MKINQLALSSILCTAGTVGRASGAPAPINFSSCSSSVGKDWCSITDLSWNQLDESSKEEFMSQGFYAASWDALGDIRWYYISEWDDLSPKFQSGLAKFGWTKEKWTLKSSGEAECSYDRPLVELRPWSRLTDEEQHIASDMGFNKYTWFTKEYEMSAYQETDGPLEKLTIEEINKNRQPTIDLPYFKDNGIPSKLTLNIPEFNKLTWDELEKSQEIVMVDDPNDKSAYKGNDEILNRLEMTVSDFIKGVKEGKQYYIKLENEHQKFIREILGENPADIIARYLVDTTVGDIARIGPKYAGEVVEQFAQLYVGGLSTTTNMHMDLQSVNFLYVAEGKKRIRLLPNDQRYSSNFTWGYEAHYSVWTGYDLLNEPLPPEGIEIILEAGQGVVVPYLTWHAVENLEPSIAFGLIRDFPATENRKLFCLGGDDPEAAIKDEYRKSLDLNWDQLPFEQKNQFRDEGWWKSKWDYYGTLRWYYIMDWNEFNEEYVQGLEKLGWTERMWNRRQQQTGHCSFDRPLVATRPWSRLTQDEKVKATYLDFDEYTWFTKEYDMTAWKYADGNDMKKENIPREPTMSMPYFKDEGVPSKITLNIPEFDKLSWETFENTKSESSGSSSEPSFDDKSDNEEAIKHILNGQYPSDILVKYIADIPIVSDMARLGDKYKDDGKNSNDVKQFVQVDVSDGSKSSSSAATNDRMMHIDFHNFNFLYVAVGRKRIRFLPNDQRYATKFTVGHEIDYSIYTEYDLLNVEPMPEDGVELTLEAGQGVLIPYMTWYAIENLEPSTPSISFKFVRNFPYTESKKICNNGIEKVEPDETDDIGEDDVNKVAQDDNEDDDDDEEDDRFINSFDLDWYDLDPESMSYWAKRGWNDHTWDQLGDLRWYYFSDWNNLRPKFQEGMKKLGWTEEKWAEKGTNGACEYERPLVELRPWSRLTKEEQEIASEMGFDKYTWHTHEFEMSAWQREDGEMRVENIVREPALNYPYFQEGFPPLKHKLDIPEFEKLSWDALEASLEYVEVDDPNDKSAKNGNDEMINRLNMTMQDFIRGIKDGKEYYIKYENDEQDVIHDILEADPSNILASYLEGTKAGDLARIGPKYYGEQEVFQFAQLYVGGKSTTTNMHLDVQSFNFLYVAAGKKRVRLLPNDQRYAKNFTWGYETHYSVWTGYDLLSKPLPPDGVEVILNAGEGVAIPYLTWHAVENVEPSIAFGLIRDFPATWSRKFWCGDNEDYEQIKEQQVGGKDSSSQESPPPPPLPRKNRSRQKHAPASLRYPMGSWVYKQFEDGMYWGQVTDYDKKTGYKVVYEDGDEEMYDEEKEDILGELIEAAEYATAYA